jgi:hypothetical protein
MSNNNGFNREGVIVIRKLLLTDRVSYFYFSPGSFEPLCNDPVWIRQTRDTIQSLHRMERKIFWLTFTVLGLFADLILPLWWALGATIPIIVLSWWIAYRSDWF